MNKTVYREVIRAPKEQAWEVLFHQYGDIHIHNPTMKTSHYMGNATKGELNCSRHCKFTDKLFLEEKITGVNGNDNFTIVVTKHNLPFVKEMSATYELSSMDDETTELKMISYNSFSPGFMKYMMRGPMSKSLRKHLFGFRYYVETGKVVNKDNYSKVFKSYQ